MPPTEGMINVIYMLTAQRLRSGLELYICTKYRTSHYVHHSFIHSFITICRAHYVKNVESSVNDACLTAMHVFRNKQVNHAADWLMKWVINDPKLLIVSPDPAICPLGLSLPRKQWYTLNRFRTNQRHCSTCCKLWGLADSDLCTCDATQTMSHIMSPDEIRWWTKETTHCWWRIHGLAEFLRHVICIRQQHWPEWVMAVRHQLAKCDIVSRLQCSSSINTSLVFTHHVSCTSIHYFIHSSFCSWSMHIWQMTKILLI